MTPLRGLLPYALAASAVVVSSAIALAASLRAPLAPIGQPEAQATATPSSFATLSASGRLAYWRPGVSIASSELWAGDLDGSKRWVIGSVSTLTEVALTRWSPDGNAVAYTLSGRGLGISRLDRSSFFIDLPAGLRAATRIVSYEWSPDSTRIAATLRGGNGLSNDSEVYLVDARAGATWERATTLGDAFAGAWIDDRGLFVETGSGMIGVLDVATKRVRPITGMQATSPLIGRDGRVYFVAGTTIAADISAQPVGGGSVWSMTIDGDDLRAETPLRRDQTRLVGMLADGRAVAGVPGSFYLAGAPIVPLAVPGDTLLKLVLSADGKRAIGIGGSRILQLDVAKLPRAPDPFALAGSLTVLLSEARNADVWFPKAEVTLAHRAGTSPEAPAARLAFLAGRALWTLYPGGAPTLALAPPSGGWIFAPVWSPDGSRLAAAVFSGPPDGRFRLEILDTATGAVLRPDIGSGPGRYVPQDRGAVAWSPSGGLRVLTVGGDRADEYTTWLVEPRNGIVVGGMSGRISWSGDRLVVLTDGQLDAQQAIRAGQRIELRDGDRVRTITDAARLAADPLLADLPDQELPAVISEVTPLADPAYLAVWLHRARSGGFRSSALAVIRVADGRAVWRLPFSPLLNWPTDVSWSPAGHLVGWTGNDADGRRQAIVVDVSTGGTVTTAAGRFAGWGPDGQWIYVARDEGLFAKRLAGGAEARVSPIGLPVVTARP